MKKFLSTATILAFVLVLLIVTKLNAQPVPVIGDFGSVASGNWTSASTWKIYSSNGAFDSTASSGLSSSYSAFILTGTTVTYDLSSQNCKNLVIQSGATLQSKNALPTSSIVYLKINGNTVWVDGSFGNGPTDALSIETKYNGTITLGGTGTVNIARLRPNSSATGTMAFVFATNANINYPGSTGTGGAGIYTDNSASVSSATITINPGVTVNFAPNCNLMIGSSSSVYGKMNTTLNINGTLNLPASNLTLIDTAGKTCSVNIGATGVLNIGKSFIPYIVVANSVGSIAAITVASGGVLNILNGGTMDFTNPGSKVTGAGSFVLQAGGSINVGSNAGLDPVAGPVQTTTTTFDTAANFSYVGTGLQALGSLLPTIVNDLTIGSNSIDSVTAAEKINGTLLVNGTLINNAGLTCGDTAVVNGTYQHNTSGAIPIATWNTGSMCLITAFTTSSNGFTNGSQNFYNVKVDIPNCNIAARLGFNGNTINGNLTIHNTNDPTSAGNNYVALFSKNGNLPVTLMGNLIIDSTAADLSIGSGSTVIGQSLIVHGDITSSGALYLNGSGVSNTLKVYGNITILNTNANSFRGHSASDKPDSVIFCGTGVQRFIKPAGLTKMDNLRLRVLSGSTLYLDDTTVVTITGSSPGSFTLDDGATLKCGNPGGLNGSFTGLAPTLSTGANYEFNGKTAQATGSFLPDTVNNLVFSNAFADTLTKGVTVTGSATIASGASVVESAGKYILGSATTTQTIGTAANSNIGGLGVGLNSGIDNLGDVTITRVSGNSGAVKVGVFVGINRSWTITQSGSAPASGRNLTLTWDSGDDKGLNVTKAVVWKSDGASWAPFTNPLGTDASGSGGIRTITANGVTSFSKWTVSDIANPLPVELSSFTGVADKEGIELKWATATELNNCGWDVEKQVNGTWTKIGSVKGSGNSTTSKQYSFMDKEALNGSFQYRLKQNDIDGTFKYSNVVEVKNNVVLSYKLGNYPNPFNPATTIAFEMPESGMVNITIYNMLGEKVATVVSERMEMGAHEINFDASRLASGTYIYRLTAGSNVISKKMLLLK